MEEPTLVSNNCGKDLRTTDDKLTFSMISKWPNVVFECMDIRIVIDIAKIHYSVVS